MKFKIITFGCKVNQYESNVIKGLMLQEHFLVTEDELTADIIIVNTCTVTSMADKKCLKYLRHIKRCNPKNILVVCGCSVQNNLKVFKDLPIDILLGNDEKTKIPKLIKDFIKNKQKHCHVVTSKDILEFEPMQLSDYNHVRAFLKIEDGCNNFCTYCIIPYVRNRVRSKDFEVILKEANTLVKTNHPEIVLTGINTGQYEYMGHDLSDVIVSLSKIPNLKRISVSSIEVTEINAKFLDTLAKTPKMVSHLHIPLQSGSASILKKMNRKYDPKYYATQIKKIRDIRPDISITTDIIVGFPGETAKLFQESLVFAQKMKFAKIHVFPYSKREGTLAAKMSEEVTSSEKKDRVTKMICLSQKLEKDYYTKFVGQEVAILIEEVKDGLSIGHTNNYIKVSLNEKLKVGSIYKRCL